MWQICSEGMLAENSKVSNYSTLQLLLLLIPTNIAICERRFTKQYIDKSALRSRLHLNTLDALMSVSLCGFSANDIFWQAAFLEWRNMRDRHIVVID